MHLDKQSLKDSAPWIATSALILVACSVWYVRYAASVHGPSGGRWQGLVLGSLGTGVMVFAFLLTLRKKYREKRWGPAYVWLQGHIWLGLISLPLILYHAGGMRLGGGVSSVLMALFYLCYISGVLGMLLQHFLPRWMLDNLPYETIDDQIEHVARENLRAARRLMRQHATVGVAAYDANLNVLPVPAEQAARDQAQADLRQFYKLRVRPFLAHNLRNPPAWLGIFPRLSRQRADLRSAPMPGPADFAAMRQRVPKDLFDVLDQLERFVAQRQQYNQQRRLHRVLHGWLLIHVPVSWAMMVLIPVHAVMALRYA